LSGSVLSFLNFKSLENILSGSALSFLNFKRFEYI
jgi:hypothetical protein